MSRATATATHLLTVTSFDCQKSNSYFRIGRVNFQKVVEESDPRILRQFKHLVEARPIPVIGSKDESEVGEIGADCPLVGFGPNSSRVLEFFSQWSFQYLSFLRW